MVDFVGAGRNEIFMRCPPSRGTRSSIALVVALPQRSEDHARMGNSERPVALQILVVDVRLYPVRFVSIAGEGLVAMTCRTSRSHGPQ